MTTRGYFIVSRPSKVLVHAERLSPVTLSFLLRLRPNRKKQSRSGNKGRTSASRLEHKITAMVRLMRVVSIFISLLSVFLMIGSGEISLLVMDHTGYQRSPPHIW